MNKFKRIVFFNLIPFLGRVYVSRNKYVNVIYYHDIVHDAGETYMRTNIDIFKRQMQFLADKGYETVRFDDLIYEDKLSFKKKRVLIAFDDGWQSNYSEIFDFMQELGVKYNIFLTIGEIGMNPDYLTWEYVKLMHESGWVGFGVHTYTHPDMSKLSEVDLSLEIDKANEIFRSHIGYAPLDFCYPYGYYSKESNHAIEAIGCYKRIYTSQMMYSYEENGTIVMGRNGINNDWPLDVFKKQADGFYNIFSRLI